MNALSPYYTGRGSTNHGLSDDDENVSLIYAFLPPMVRRSMPKVRSLRRSWSTYRSLTAQSHDSNVDESESGTITPPPAYHEALAPLTSVFSDDESFAIGEPSTSTAKSTGFAENEDSGIQWKYATQGLNLYNMSARESTAASSDAAFSRRLYLDATTYLLRGLPEDLTEEELISLRAAMPDTLIQSTTPIGQLTIREEGDQTVQRDAQVRDQDPTVLHRVVSMAVLQLFLFASFIWPYIQVFVRSAYEYERRYHISEQFAMHTWSTANAIGKRTVATANLVCTWNDGQVGDTLESMFAWWIQGVAGGLCEGLGEGMEVFGVKPMSGQRKRRNGSREQNA